MFNEDDFEAYYDGELALRPFFRAYFRDRWMRLKAFVWYRLLRRPRPVHKLGGGCASLSTLTEMYKRMYTVERVEAMASQPLPLYALPKGKSASFAVAIPRPDFDAKGKE